MGATLPEVLFAPPGPVHMMCTLPSAAMVASTLAMRFKRRLSGDEGLKKMGEIVKDVNDAALVAFSVIDVAVARSGAPFAIGEDPTASEPVAERAETLMRVVLA